MNRTNIQWCDYTWNPITGCSPVSAGCEHCYAERMSHRMRWTWGRPVYHPERLDEPLRVKTASRIFVCSMGDFFHEDCTPIWQDRVTATMAMASWHTFIVLTKRTWGMRLWRDRMIDDGLWPLPNVWLGVTVEGQTTIDRWHSLCHFGNHIRFASVEPMLGPVTFAGCYLKPDWVVCGPETGPGARPCNPKWIEALSRESPCFFDKRPNGKRREWPI